MRAYLPDIIQLVAGLVLIVILLYLVAVSEGWLTLLGILATAVVYFGWWRVLLNLGWRLAGKDPDDIDFHLPG